MCAIRAMFARWPKPHAVADRPGRAGIAMTRISNSGETVTPWFAIASDAAPATAFAISSWLPGVVRCACCSATATSRCTNRFWASHSAQCGLRSLMQSTIILSPSLWAKASVKLSAEPPEGSRNAKGLVPRTNGRSRTPSMTHAATISGST
jgi:hypothetical protein